VIGSAKRPRFWLSVAAFFALLGLAPQAWAGDIAFWVQDMSRDSNRDFVWSAGATSASLTAVSIPVVFDYTGVVGTLPTALQGNQLGHVTITGLNTTTHATTSGNNYSQLISGTYTIAITRDTPFGGHTNLLTATVTPNTRQSGIFGKKNDPFGQLFATEDPFNAKGTQKIHFTSDFVAFTSTAFDNLTVNLNHVLPPGITVGSNFLNNFAAESAGTNNDPMQTPHDTFGSAGAIVPVPEPSTLALGSVGLLGLAGLGLYRRRTLKVS